MQVRELSSFTVDIPTQQDEYVMSHGRVLSAFPSVVVKVVADDGTVGFGEAGTLGSNYLDGFPASARETVRLLADWVFECDVLEAGVLVDGMDDRVIGNLTGKAAIDIAMWDLRGKILGRPVAQLLGGVKQASFPAVKAISLAHPVEMVDAVRHASDFGYRGWQLKIGDNPIEDAARVRAVAQVVPDDSTFMTSDANKGWTVAQTLRFVREIRDVDTYLEQPCPTTAELARVRATADLPVMIDESLKEGADVLAALASGAADAVNLKIVRVGGLTKAARIRDLAQIAGWPVFVDEPQGADLATAGIAHLAATIEPGHFLGAAYFMGEEMKISYQRPGATTGPTMADGRIHYSDAPGLGVEIDENSLGQPDFTITRARS
ncbi:mandelate racemase/muconate lactonizing enzyme family protein [Nocardia sp. NPDC052254]|uniref:mandelate racemase/muconate lactonizing enzyme family protein n=1 Tax=Nocardia sp. NPDC052254 TaxID=3155681 RepID=UPI0034214023